MRTKAESPSEIWTREKLKTIARDHFGGRNAALENLVRGLVERHRKIWKSQATGSYRPTASMYALALQWQVDALGPKCAVCDGKIVLPETPAEHFATGSQLTLAPRVLPSNGGLNVPQNLVLCHSGCMPGL
jgi:hypothetical protein